MKRIFLFIVAGIMTGCFGDSGKSGHPNANVPHCSVETLYREEIENVRTIFNIDYNTCDNVTRITTINNVVIDIIKGDDKYSFENSDSYIVERYFEGVLYRREILYHEIEIVEICDIVINDTNICDTYGNGIEYQQTLNDMEWSSERAVLTIQHHITIHSIFE